jgi:hypothetical protein
VRSATGFSSRRSQPIFRRKARTYQQKSDWGCDLRGAAEIVRMEARAALLLLLTRGRALGLIAYSPLRILYGNCV